MTNNPMYTPAGFGVFLRVFRSWIVVQILIGFLLGFVLLHPVSMLIYRWLDSCFAEGMPDVQSQDFLAPFFYAFNPTMFPMGIMFGLIGVGIAVVTGYQRRIIEKQSEQLVALERAKRRTSQFMVHDLKTHLGCILGFTNLLLEKKEIQHSAETLEALQRIRRQAHRMKTEVSVFLDLARLEETNALAEKEKIFVQELLCETAKDFALPAHEKPVEIGEHHKHCPPVEGNARLLTRTLSNLVSNAFKHNGPRTHVFLDAEVWEEEGNTAIRFSCCDDGAGIPPEISPTIFDEFSTTGTQGDGSSGLGLAFCKAAVEAHGGHIWCENTETKGTNFYFTIPIFKENKS